MEVKDGKKEIFDGSVTPMFTQYVSRILGTRQEVEIDELGCYCFTHAMERQSVVTFVKFCMDID